MSVELSIVIPTRDTRPLTIQCLRSLRTATLLDAAEIVVVDDGSTDGTAAAIRREFPAVRILASPTSQGFTTSANRGVADTIGDVVLLLNSDTEVAPDAPRRLAAALAVDPWLGACGPQLYFPDGSLQWSAGRDPDLLWFFVLATGLTSLTRHIPRPRPRRPPPQAAVPVAWLRGAALAVRRKAWLEVGAFDERFRFYCQDLDLCQRLRAGGWGVALVPGARVVHHQGATIARESGTVVEPAAARERYHAELLWTDFVRLVEKHRGLSHARRAAAVMRLGGRLRVAARTLVTPIRRTADRARWREDTRSFRRAVDALSREIRALAGR